VTGEVYVVTPASTTHSAFYTVAYSSGGAEQWAKTYTGPNGASPRGLAVSPGGGAVVVTGSAVVPVSGGGFENAYETIAYSG
jgi:hypothetical protein